MLLLLACAPMSPPAAVTEVGSHVVLRGGTVVGAGQVDVEIDEGRVVRVEEGIPGDSVDASDRWIVPAFIDSHVHLAYLPQGEALASGGIAGVVDLAAPLEFLSADHGSLRVIASGPMVTAEGGYPTQGWGHDGYGLECADAAAAEAAVDRLAELGAGVIKLPVTSEPVLPPDALAAAVTRAHQRGLKVASHATGDAEAMAAAEAGVDVLAHTPVEALSPETIEAWRGRAVITTVRAFGGSVTTMNNLAALREAGVTVLYGTDFGNTRSTGIDAGEVAKLMQAGMDGAAIVTAGTAAPAVYWGFADLGSIEPGKAASFLVLTEDPFVNPMALATPEQVWIEGVRRL